LAEKLKREFIELLEKDVEFRYTVAGYLGLSEILKRLDRHESHILEILKRLDRLEENQEKLGEEVRALREEQRKLWEGQNK
jgi:predicted nuclease with TOPRIM domain